MQYKEEDLKGCQLITDIIIKTVEVKIGRRSTPMYIKIRTIDYADV